MDINEIQQRVARLNTQLRFGRHQAALTEAYKLRTFVQLSGNNSKDAKRELERAEIVIRELERKQASGIQKLVQVIVRTATASLNPEVDHDETLLDRFKDSVQHVEEFEDEVEDEVKEKQALESPSPDGYWGEQPDEQDAPGYGWSGKS